MVQQNCYTLEAMQNGLAANLAKFFSFSPSS